MTTELSSPSASSPSSSSHHEWKSLLQPTLLGLPLLVSYDSSWACSRLRYQIFLNSLRLFAPGCEQLSKAEKALTGGAANFVAQFLLSAQLEVRLVDQHGTSAPSPLPQQPPADPAGTACVCACVCCNLACVHEQSIVIPLPLVNVSHFFSLDRPDEQRGDSSGEAD